jgi:hypothetical protein
MKNTTFHPCKAAKKWMKVARRESFDFFAGGTSVGVCSLIADSRRVTCLDQLSVFNPEIYF